MILCDVGSAIELAASLREAPDWPPSAYANALEAKALPQRLALAAESAEGRMAGFLIAVLIAPQAELELVAVDTVFQRKGVARRLMQRMSEELRNSGITEVTLEVRDSNLPARALYASLGFSVSGKRPRYYADPVEDAIQMQLLI